MSPEVVIAVTRVRHSTPVVPLPQYMTPGAAGMDVRAVVDDSVVLGPGERCLIPTGMAMAIPHGFEVQIRPRSGLALRHGVTVLNAPGTIDADYRGEIQILLVNVGDAPYTVAAGDRIAQMVVAPVVQATLEEHETLPSSTRGAGGFGHTGVE